MGLLTPIVKWFVSIVWPEIRALIERLIPAFLEWLHLRIRHAMDANTRRSADAADHKAASAADLAQHAATREEAERQRAVAEVWRDVAEQFRHNNERLKDEVARAVQEAKSAAQNSASQLQVDDVFRLAEDRVSLRGDVVQRLLPPPTNDPQHSLMVPRGSA